MLTGLKSVGDETRLAVFALFTLDYRRLRGDPILTYALFEQGSAESFFSVDPANTRREHEPHRKKEAKVIRQQLEQHRQTNKRVVIIFSKNMPELTEISVHTGEPQEPVDHSAEAVLQIKRGPRQADPSDLSDQLQQLNMLWIGDNFTITDESKPYELAVKVKETYSKIRLNEKKRKWHRADEVMHGPSPNHKQSRAMHDNLWVHLNKPFARARQNSEVVECLNTSLKFVVYGGELTKLETKSSDESPRGYS
ncbi:hypothetical protein CSKR_202737 [Clonorchis sinensis]|uniref:Uncharacterized protein n=1 Tax=Clonorchis sinensis TaxID=79923 RepID=A0A8T1M2H6_CLOSI|nr:hypothetical protein CSKR_202737 [Clonorchis sinensis]